MMESDCAKLASLSTVKIEPKAIALLQEYKPAKLKIGCPHPDPVVESNSLMSVDPPELPYQDCHHLQVSPVPQLSSQRAPKCCGRHGSVPGQIENLPQFSM